MEFVRGLPAGECSDLRTLLSQEGSRNPLGDSSILCDYILLFQLQIYKKHFIPPNKKRVLPRKNPQRGENLPFCDDSRKGCENKSHTI